MSIDMYVSSSQAQASSANTMCQKQIQGYQELQQAINQFVMSSGELQGKTYDSAKQYFSAVLQPLAKGGMLLSEAVAEACQKFPDDYQSQVDSADLKSSELEEQIQQYQQGIDTANAIIQALSANPEMGVLMKSVLRGVKNVKEGQEKAKKKLEKKLRKLKKFHASSPSIFSEIATLEAAINTGAAQAGTCWNASAGTFSVPKQEEMTWAANVNTLWEKKEAAKNEKIEVKKVTIPGKVNGDGYYYQIFVDGVYDKEASEKYNLDRVKKRTIEGLYHLGELSGINDFYRVATGKDWYTGTKDSRIKAAGFTLLDLIGGKILIKGAKALKIGEIFSAGKKVTKVKVTTKAGRTINKGTVIKGKKTGKYKKTSVAGKIKRTQADLDDLARDPSHGGSITKGSKLERDIGLALEERGDLGHIVRDKTVNGGSEFIDTVTGKKYDIKSFISYPNGHTSPKKGAFTVDKAMGNIMKELDRGYDVIINTTNLIPEHRTMLINELKNKGLINKIIFYP